MKPQPRKFIIVHGMQLEAEVVPEMPARRDEGDVFIGVLNELHMRQETPFEAVVSECVDEMWRATDEYEEERDAARRESERTGVWGGNGWGTPPDAWILAIAAVMWQGLVSGFTYDVVKQAGLRLLRKLRKAGIGPTGTGRQTKKRLEFEAGRYRRETEEEFVEELFVRLRRRVESLPHRTADAITQDLPADGTLSDDARYESHGESHPPREIRKDEY